MRLEVSEKVSTLLAKLQTFMEDVVYPNETTYFDQLEAGGDRWKSPAIMDTMKSTAQAAGLWNLFLPESDYGAGLPTSSTARLIEGNSGTVHYSQGS